MGSAQLSVPQMAPEVSVWKKAKLTKCTNAEGRCMSERRSMIYELRATAEGKKKSHPFVLS